MVTPILPDSLDSTSALRFVPKGPPPANTSLLVTAAADDVEDEDDDGVAAAVAAGTGDVGGAAGLGDGGSVLDVGLERGSESRVGVDFASAAESVTSSSSSSSSKSSSPAVVSPEHINVSMWSWVGLHV